VIPGKHYGPDDLLKIARRRKWVIILPLVLIAAGVATVAHFLPDQFRSDTLILVVPQRVPESYVRATVTTSIADRLQSITQQILSRTRLERIIQDFNLYQKERKTGIMEDIVEQMRKDILVDIVKGDAFRVSFTADDARTSMKVTERLASLFIEENLRDREVLAEGTNQFLEAQLEDARRRLVDNEKKLEEYRRSHSAELPSQKDANLQGLHNTEMQLQALRDSLSRDQDNKLLMERAIADLTADEAAAAAPPAPAPVEAPTDPLSPALASADQLKAAQANLQAMLLRLTPQHPDVIRMRRIIAELQRKVDAEASAVPVSAGPPPPAPPSPAAVARKNRTNEMRAQLDNLTRDIARKQSDDKQLQGVIAQYQRNIEAAPTREAELAELTRDYDTLQKVYHDLLSKKEDSKVAANLERRQIGEQFKILDPARLPEKPYSPDRVRINIIGSIVALVVGLGLAALLEYEDECLRSEDDAAAVLGMPVLATIPIIPAVAARRWWRRRAVVALSVGTVATLVAIGATIAWRLR